MFYFPDSHIFPLQRKTMLGCSFFFSLQEGLKIKGCWEVRNSTGLEEYKIKDLQSLLLPTQTNVHRSLKLQKPAILSFEDEAGQLHLVGVEDRLRYCRKRSENINGENRRLKLGVSAGGSYATDFSRIVYAQIGGGCGLKCWNGRFPQGVLCTS